MSDATSFDTLKRIQELIELKGWTVYKLAQFSNIPYSNLNNIINRGSQPTISTIAKICGGFNISLAEFFSSETKSLVNGNEISATEKEMIEKYRSLTKNDKKLLQAYLSGLTRE